MSMTTIPDGWCQCGCGQRTKIAQASDPKRGIVKGHPRRFLRGHHNPYASQKIRKAIDNGDGTATIPLTKGYSTTVSIEDLGLVEGFNWFVVESRNTAYAARAGARGKEPRHILLHRVITRAPSGKQVDHIDGNGLNNTRGNLRVCTHQQNMMNKSTYSNSPTGLRGVYPVPSGRYIARIRVNGKWINLGTYSTPKEAAVVRDRASREHYGEFGQLNFSERKAS